MLNLLRRLKRLVTGGSAAERFWRNRERILHPRGLQKHLRPLYVHRNQKILDRCCAYIPISEKVPPFATPHGLFGIFISYGADIGEGCTIFHHVTIGSNTLRSSRGQGAPTIGENVFIGAGAKIIGGVTIGGGARIGAGCVVTHDIPAGATAVMPAPRIILRDTPPDNTFEPWSEYNRQV